MDGELWWKSEEEWSAWSVCVEDSLYMCVYVWRLRWKTKLSGVFSLFINPQFASATEDLD